MKKYSSRDSNPEPVLWSVCNFSCRFELSDVGCLRNNLRDWLCFSMKETWCKFLNYKDVWGYLKDSEEKNAFETKYSNAVFRYFKVKCRNKIYVGNFYSMTFIINLTAAQIILNFSNCKYHYKKILRYWLVECFKTNPLTNLLC